MQMILEVSVVVLVLSSFVPPQDYYCELSPLQEELYEDFAHTQASHSISDALHSDSSSREGTISSASRPQHTHIFQVWLTDSVNDPVLGYLDHVCCASTFREAIGFIFLV